MRKLSQRDVLAMVLNTWHHGRPNPHFGPSVHGTAWFLWLVVLAALALGGVAFVLQLVGQGEEHCDDRARAGTTIKCAQDLEAQPAARSEHDFHGGMVSAPAPRKYVRGGRA